MRNFINKESTRRLATALREIHDNLTNGYHNISLVETLKSHTVPYFSIIPTVLKIKGVVEGRYETKNKKQTLHWITTTEPSTTMASAIYRACVVYTNQHKSVKIKPIAPKEQYLVTKTTQPINNPINQLQQSFDILKTGLMSLGIPEKESIGIIKSYIK